MVWVCSMIYFFSAILGRLHTGRWVNLLTFFAGFYGITIFFAGFRLFGFNAATDKECVVLILGIIAFTIGFLASKPLRVRFGSHRRFHERNQLNFEFSSAFELRKYVLLAVTVFVVLYALYRVSSTLQLLSSGYSYSQLRTIYFGAADDIFGSGSRYGRSAVSTYVYLPLLYSLIIIASIALFKDIIDEKYRKQFIAIVFIAMGLQAFASGGREIIFNTVMIVLFSFFVFDERFRNLLRRAGRSGRRRIGIFLLIAVAGVAVLIMSVNRSQASANDASSFLKMIYVYFCGYVPNLGIRIEDVAWADMTYGYTFLLGLIKPIAAIIRSISGVSFPDAYNRADTLTILLQNRVDIGGGYMFNAYASVFYYFFMDFGFFSVVVESLLYGLLCGICEKNFLTYPNQRNTFIYLYIFLGLASSMVRWEFVHPRTAMIVYFIFILFKRSSEKQGEHSSARLSA